STRRESSGHGCSARSDTWEPRLLNSLQRWGRWRSCTGRRSIWHLVCTDPALACRNKDESSERTTPKLSALAMDHVGKLVAEETVEIHSPASRVWEVLVLPKYIKQWDDVPEGCGEEHLRSGSGLEWPGHARLTVTHCEPCRLLRLVLFVPKWEAPVPEDIAYTYRLEGKETGTVLSITVGDFGRLPDGKRYY